PGQPADLEPTCLALLALAGPETSYQNVIDKGYAALERHATGDGLYRLQSGRPEAIWPTALVLFLHATLRDRHLRAEQSDQGPCGRSAAALLALRGGAAFSKEAQEIHDINLHLVGWPWAEGTFSWIEPTAWACLALRRAGFGDHPRV